jgi:hypothetical protein
MSNDEYRIRLNLRKVWFRINDEKVQKFQETLEGNLIRWSLSWSLNDNYRYRKHSCNITRHEK